MSTQVVGCRPCLPAPPPPAPGTHEGSGITENAITMNALLTNALTSNPDTLEELLDNPLTTGSFGPGTMLGEALWDPSAQQVMEYLVGCALGPSESVIWAPADTGTEPVEPIEWQGELGLCPQWGEGSVSEDVACQELISACLLARNNAFGVPVSISARGFDTRGNYFGMGEVEVAGNTFPEHQVYRWREGAFYGNLFDVTQLDPAIRVTAARVNDRVRVFYDLLADEQRRTRHLAFEAPVSEYTRDRHMNLREARDRAHRELLETYPLGRSVVMYRSAFACWSPEWTSGDAYFHDRLCAGPTGEELCLAMAVGACADSEVVANAPQNLCQDVHLPDVGYFDFDDCTGDAAAPKNPWPYPITVFLRQPCDLVRNQRFCARRDAGASSSVVRTPIPR